MRYLISAHIVHCRRLIVGAALMLWALPALAQNPIDFTLKDLEGNVVRLSDFLGKNVILIDFWATWCIPCVKELAHLERFHKTYRDQGLVVLALSEDGPESAAQVKPFVKRYNYTFTVLLDTESQVLAHYDPRGALPFGILIDRSGRIARVHQGYSLGDEKKLEQEILELIEPKKEAAAGKVSAGVNEAILWRNFSDREYVRGVRGGRQSQLINRLDLTVASGAFLAGGRIDTDADFSPYQGSFSLAKKFIEFSRKDLQVLAGDYYTMVGRGLAFSLLKTFEQEGLEYIIDSTVSGGKLAASAGDLSGEMFGGWIVRNAEPFTNKEVIRDAVYGASLGCAVKNVGQLKFNFVGSNLKPGSTLGNKSMALESIALDIPSFKEKAKFYGEILILQKKIYYEEGTIDGHAVYLESSLLFKNLTFLFEFKDYKNLDFEYNRPPLLETELIPIVANQFANSSKDITGIASRLDFYLPRSSLLIFGKFTHFDDKPGSSGRTINHVFAGIEKKFKESGWLSVLAGARRENSSALLFYYTTGWTFHYQANLSYPLTDRLSIEVDLQSKDFRGRLNSGGTFLDYYDRRSFLSLCYSPALVLTLFYDRTSDPEILTFMNRKNWLGGQVEIKFSRANFIRIFVGANKGGVKCASGVCKFFPPFTGVRIDSVFRY